MKRRTMHFHWDKDHDRPLKITHDPWEEGKPQTTLSLTKDEAQNLAKFITSITD